MRIGYARVSTVDQDPEFQIRALEQAHCERIYTEHAAGVSRKRPEIERLFDARRDRLTRSVREVNACDPLPELLNRRMSQKTTPGTLTRPPKSAPEPLSVMRSSSIR